MRVCTQTCTCMYVHIHDIRELAIQTSKKIYIFDVAARGLHVHLSLLWIPNYDTDKSLDQYLQRALTCSLIY